MNHSSPRGIRALVIEDHPAQGRLAANLLQRIGCESIVLVETGRDAVQQFADDSFDLVLLDLGLPDMNGIEVLKAIREQEDSQPRVVVVSAADEMILRSIRALADRGRFELLDVIQKPLSLARLQRAFPPDIATGAMNEHENADNCGRVPSCSGTQFCERGGRLGRPSLCDRMSLNDAEAAIRASLVEPYFEPQIGVHDLGCTKAEVLCRICMPNGDVHLPGSFIPVIEGTPLMRDLTWQVFEKALDIVSCRSAEIGEIRLSFNLPPELIESSLPQRLTNMCLLYGVSPATITIELTESSQISVSLETQETLTALRLCGFGLAIDDFGTGFSNLKQLNENPISELKIDRGFIKDALAYRNGWVIAESVTRLSRKFNIRCVAEGVDCIEKAVHLIFLRVDYLQGFLFARAMHEDDFCRWIAGWNSSVSGHVFPDSDVPDRELRVCEILYQLLGLECDAELLAARASEGRDSAVELAAAN